MKKHLLLILSAAVFILGSCSNDDDGDIEESLVATWTLESTSPPLFDFSECPTRPTITFNENGTTEWTFYTSGNDCEGETDTGTWERNAGNNYTVTIPGYGEFDGVVHFESSNEFTFTSVFMGVTAVLTFVK